VDGREQREAERQPIVNVEGERVALGPLRRDLIPHYQRWNNDLAVTRTLRSSLPMTIEQEATGFDAVVKDERYALFTIYERATGRPIGLTYLADVDHQNRSAEFGIVIGERDCHGKGYGTETTRLVLDYAFTALGLHNVMLTCREHNVAGRRAYEKAGFKEFGRRRQCKWLNGRLWDNIYMDCLASEFESPVLARVFVPDEPRTDRALD
jgi:RimJ/RimL family protein N-acetyltransferase